MYCKKCGKETSDAASFCPYCGAKTAAVIADMKEEIVNPASTANKNNEHYLRFATAVKGDVTSIKFTRELIGIEETEKGLKYVTKGDNNLTKDTEEISYEQILGTIVLKIPRIGNIILLLEDKIYIILLLNLILIIYINTKRVEEKKKMRREKKKIEDKRK